MADQPATCVEDEVNERLAGHHDGAVVQHQVDDVPMSCPARRQMKRGQPVRG
jgi:hypothetical protein